MSTLARRTRHRAEVRAAIIEAALDIIAEHGLAALSIRAIADRVEYSAGSIYLHFESKEALLQEMAQEGFRRMHEAVRAAVARCGERAERAVLLRALAAAYLDFALEHTAYFRVMFDVPRPGESGCLGGAPGDGAGDLADGDGAGGPARPSPCAPACAEGLRVPLAALATVHGLVSLFLSGRLDDVVGSRAELLALTEDCLTPYASP
jgi:AcrR family transcriptional regulator